MSKPYSKLLGNRVYIDFELPVYTIEVSETIKKEMVEKAAQKLNRAKVYDIGTGVAQPAQYKIGDEVMVGKEGITRGDLVTLNKDKMVLCVNPLDIMMVW